MTAIALRQQISNIYGIQIDASMIRFSIGTSRPATGIRFAYPTPGIVHASIAQFDHDKDKVKPFEFTLDGREAYIRVVTPTGPRTPTVSVKQPMAIQTKAKKRRNQLRRDSSRRYAGVPMVNMIREIKSKNNG
jgi:hypothetical protein